MIRYLNQNFINVWVLLTDMKRLVRQQPKTPESRFAQAILNSYSFPVVIAAMPPEGDKVLATFNLNDLHQRCRRDRPMSYSTMLLFVALNLLSPYDASLRAQFQWHMMEYFFYNMKML